MSLCFLSEQFEKCLQVPTKEEMNAIANTAITKEMIQLLKLPRDKKVLNRWLGFTIKEALDAHTNGLVQSVPS